MIGSFLNFFVSLPIYAFEFIGENKYMPCCNIDCAKICEKEFYYNNHQTTRLSIDDVNCVDCFCDCIAFHERKLAEQTFSYKITLLEQISLVFQQAKSSQRLITTLRKNINTLDLDTLKTMFTNMKQDFSEIQKMMTANNQGTAESWQEVYEYIDNVIRLNPSVDSKSNIHQQVETTLKLIESKSVSISKSLAQLEGEIYLETSEMLNKVSETERNYFLPQLEKIHNANQQLINH